MAAILDLQVHYMNQMLQMYQVLTLSNIQYGHHSILNIFMQITCKQLK